MKKDLKKVILKLVLSLAILILFNFYNTSYAFENENKLDILIENQQKQKDLKVRISELDNILESKNQEKESEEEYINTELNSLVEVVTVSFVPKEEAIQEKQISQSEKISAEIAAIEQNKNTLDKELQDVVIQSVQIEKLLQEEVAAKLESEGSDFLTSIWPLQEYKDISSAYGYRIHPITNIESFHKGIDIPAPQDTDVLAVDNGIVSFSGYQNGYGNVVKIKHFDGKETVYAHNNSLVAQVGDIVKQGQVISKVGSTGNSTGNHVHFEIIVNGENINPIDGVIK